MEQRLRTYANGWQMRSGQPKITLVNMETEKCSCLTSSLGEACVCVKVLRNLTQKPQTE